MYISHVNKLMIVQLRSPIAKVKRGKDCSYTKRCTQFSSNPSIARESLTDLLISS